MQFARRIVTILVVATRARIETTIVPDKKGGFGTLPTLLIVLCGGFPQKFVSDLESPHLSDSTHFGSARHFGDGFCTPTTDWGQVHQIASHLTGNCSLCKSLCMTPTTNWGQVLHTSHAPCEKMTATTNWGQVLCLGTSTILLYMY